jgi:amidase
MARSRFRPSTCSLVRIDRDGEVSGTGIEIGARVTVRIGLEKDGAAAWPRIETPDHWICIASAPTYEAASEIVVREMMFDIQERLGLLATEAFMLSVQLEMFG